MLCQNHTEFETHIFKMRKTENHTIYLVSFLCEFRFFLFHMNFSKNINNQLKINVIKDEDSLISHKYLTILNSFLHTKL